MEIYYEPDERIIATTIPPFDRKKRISQTQIRIKEDGTVIYRQFQVQGLEFQQIAEDHFQISRVAVDNLLSIVAGLMKHSASMPITDDSGSRQIALQHADGVYESVQFPNGGGRKHHHKKGFEEVWQAINDTTKHNSEQADGGNQIQR